MRHFSVLFLAVGQHDVGIREVAAATARFAYVLMCLTLCWGILTSTGWVRRITGHHAVRGGHMMLAAFTLAAGLAHASVFLLLRFQGFTVFGLIIPFLGTFTVSLGIIGFDLLILIAIVAGLRRWINYRRWLRFHQVAYVAVALLAVHSFLGAIANGHLDALWLAGVTVLVPPLTLTALRFLPPRWLIYAGLLESPPDMAAQRQDRGIAPASKADQPTLRPVHPTPVSERDAADRRFVVSVDNQLCRQYGFCQAEAPELFQLLADGRLRYEAHPQARLHLAAQAAARACPMRAIELKEPGP